MWNNARALNAIANSLIGLVVLALVAALIWWLAHLPAFTLRAVQIGSMSSAPLQHVQPLQVREAMMKLHGSFFTLDLVAVRQNLRQMPWVRDVVIRRVFPNQLQISFEEHKAVAAWGQGQLVNSFGELFIANSAEADEACDLVELSGPAGSEQMVIRRAAQVERWLEPIGTPLSRLELSARNAWRAVLQDGMTLEIGREQWQVSVADRVQRYVKAHTWLVKERAVTPVAVDLRYATGFAFRPLTVAAKGKDAKNIKTPSQALAAEPGSEPAAERKPSCLAGLSPALRRDSEEPS